MWRKVYIFWHWEGDTEYSTNEKPSSADVFMNHFVNEWITLKQTGINVRGTVNIKAWLYCPAKAFLKCITGHTGTSACERCTVIGTRVGNHTVYNDVENCEMRTGESLQKITLLMAIRMTLVLSSELVLTVKDSAIEELHLSSLSATRRLLHYLKAGPRCCRLSASQIQITSDKLRSISGTMSSEFAYQPRGLDELVSQSVYGCFNHKVKFVCKIYLTCPLCIDMHVL